MPGENGRSGRVHCLRLNSAQEDVLRRACASRQARLETGGEWWLIPRGTSLGTYMRDAAIAMALRELKETARADRGPLGTGVRAADVPDVPDVPPAPATKKAKAKKPAPAKAKKKKPAAPAKARAAARRHTARSRGTTQRRKSKAAAKRKGGSRARSA